MSAGQKYIGVGVGAVIVISGKILLLKRSKNAKNEKGCWENPGGAVELGETFAEAIHREIFEELRVKITIIGKLPIQECFLKQDNQHWITQTFIVQLHADQVPKLQEPHKHDDIGWFALDSLPAPMSSISEEDIRRFLRNNTKR